MLIQADRLTRLLTAVLERAGAVHDHARICAEHLVAANLKGHDSHGVGMAPSYVRWIAAGTLFPNRHARVIQDHVAVMVMDGQFGLGQVVARETVDLAIARARQTGVACVALRNACHIGRIGTYGEQCADAGLVSMHYVNVIGHDPMVAPFAGAEPRMITNPYCCTVPQADGRHIVLDFATSAIAIGKLRVAMMKGEPAPENVLIDAQGKPTTDPRTIFTTGPRGFLLPFGQHKGGGMQVMCELLGGALAGHWTMQPDGERDYGAAVNNMLSIVIDPDAFGGRAAYEAEASAMIDYIRSTRPADGVEAVLVAGDPERASMAARLRDGVPIDDNSWRDIMNAAMSVGLDEAAVAAIA
ncbi:MAG: malate/lactate/ureidoglycolate dehydrogenase [Caulobacterales bacterium]